MSLSPEQVLRVANAHILDGIDQHKLAALFGVNQGRIAEAVGAIQFAMANHMMIYKMSVNGKTTFAKNGDQE